MRPDVASVVGVATDEQWGQVLITPQAYGVVEILAQDGIARSRGVSILTKLTRIFDAPPVSLQELSQMAESVISEDVISILLMVPVGQTLYLVSRGEGSVYLKRGNKMARLLHGRQSLSGSIQEGDTLVITSASFDRALTLQEIAGVFDHLTPTEVAERLTIKLHEHEGGEGGAAFIYRVGEEPKEATLPKQPLPPPPRKRTIILSKVKSVGRRITSPRQRLAIRNMAKKLHGTYKASPQKVIAGIVIALFLISVGLGIRRQMTARADSKISETLVVAQHSFEEGMALLDLNPVKGRERLVAARDALAPLIAKKSDSADWKKAKRLYDEVTANVTRAMRVIRATPELYFDMSLLKAGSTATDVSLFGHTFGVFDGRGGTAYTLGVGVKNGTIVGGGATLTNSLHIASYGDKLYFWNPKGIHELRLTDQKVTSAKIPPSTEWGQVTDMDAFGGNLYLLDVQKSRVWKYVSTDKGFSDMYEYLNPDTLPDLSKATNMSIDGSVWIGTTVGRILRFTAGKENPFTPTGLDFPLGATLYVFTSDEAKMVYVLDSSRNRVVVFDKDGLYMAQYLWESGFAPKAVFAVEEAGKLFLLRDGKLYAVNMK